MVEMSLLNFLGIAEMITNFIDENKIDNAKEIKKYIIRIDNPKLDGTIDIGFGKLM